VTGTSAGRISATSGSINSTALAKHASVSASPLSQPAATPTTRGAADPLAHAAMRSVRPESTSRTRAASRTLRARGPGESWLALIGTTPRVGTVPTVGLKPTTPLSAAGQVIEPLVSVPMATGA
jgi:hypothetical protein